MICALSAQGGMIHITFHDAFLSQEYADARKALATENDLLEQQAEEKFGQNEAQKLIAAQRLSDDRIRAGKLPQVSWEKIVEHVAHVVRVAGTGSRGAGLGFRRRVHARRDGGRIEFPEDHGRPFSHGIYRVRYTENPGREYTSGPGGMPARCVYITGGEILVREDKSRHNMRRNIPMENLNAPKL